MREPVVKISEALEYFQEAKSSFEMMIKFVNEKQSSMGSEYSRGSINTYKAAIEEIDRRANDLIRDNEGDVWTISDILRREM